MGHRHYKVGAQKQIMTNLLDLDWSGAGVAGRVQFDYCRSPGHGGSDGAITLEATKSDHILDVF